MKKKQCPSCKTNVVFVKTLVIRNTTFQGDEGTVSPYDKPKLDSEARKCPNCGFTVGKDVAGLWNPR